MLQIIASCSQVFTSIVRVKADEAIQRKRRLILGICKHRLATVLDLMGLTAPEKM